MINNSAPSYALVGGTLFDGTGTDSRENFVIIVTGNLIEAVGQKDQVEVPQGCEVIDVSGKTVMPGMMDLHVHLALGSTDVMVPHGSLSPLLDKPMTLIGIKGFARARRTLEMGFTTLRDAGDVGYLSVALRDAINMGMVEGPRIVASGQFLSTTSGHADFMPLWLLRTDDETNVADGIAGVLKAVRRQVKMKTDWVKFFATGGIMDPEDKQEFNDDELRVLVDTAHDKEKWVCAHCMHPQGTLAAVKAGIDTVEHGSHVTEEIVDLMLKKGTYLIPTIYAPFANVNQGEKFGLPKIYMDKCRPIVDLHIKSFQMALKAGIKIAMGTDAGYTPCPHGTNAFELELLVKYGMSPMEAIQSATKNAASALRLDDKLGTIEKGKLADIIVVEGDPLKDIGLLQKKEKIKLVMKEGTIYFSKI
jgi:imidazolonepropionase-like amidohydrolase